MKGVFNLRPPLPRYDDIWDVSQVLGLLKSMSPVRFLSLKDLTLKTTVLLALTLAARSQSLHLLDIANMKKGKSTFTFKFAVNELKQSRPG